MVDYLKVVLGDSPEEITGSVPTPASEQLFDVRPGEERIMLNEEQARAFHHAVAQLLFASSRSRNDIQTAVSLLTIKVKQPDKDDWGKLKQLLRYIRSTIYMPLVFRLDSLNIIKWWVDASYATHGDCRGQTGATMSLGWGSVIGMSKKQKLNKKSSTWCDLVGVDNASPQMLYTRYFVEEQGYGVEASILNHDNLSEILNKKNRRASSRKGTKHINLQYFFIKDRISSGESTVKHCPATEMLEDHFTKPLQGTMFRKFRSEIQGIPIDMCDADLGWDRPCMKNEQKEVGASPSPQGCVGTYERAYVGKKTSAVVPTVGKKDTGAVPTKGKKDTSTVSKDTVIGGARGGRTTYLRIPTKRKSYACALIGK
jgi:hypothetical protein